MNLLDEKLDSFINQCLTEKGRKKIEERRKPHGLKHLLIEANPLGRAYLFKKAKDEILKKTQGHYPAPFLALKVIEETNTMPLDKGLEKEKATLINSIPTLAPVAKKLIHLFFVQEALKKVTGAPAGTNAAAISNIGVIGAGTMGIGITFLCSNAGFHVRMKDVNWDVLGKAFGAISKLYEKMLKRRKIKPHEANLKKHLISATTDYSGFKTVDLAIEAATRKPRFEVSNL